MPSQLKSELERLDRLLDELSELIEVKCAQPSSPPCSCSPAQAQKETKSETKK